MRKPIIRVVPWLLAMSSLVVGIVPVLPLACAPTCEELGACGRYTGNLQMDGGDPDTDAGPDPECIPSNNPGPLAETCDGVFVSSGNGDDANNGTRDKPVKTFAKAIELGAATKPVYACAEPFTEHVTVPGGATIYGGLDCANGWAYVGASKRTAISAATDQIVLVLESGTGTTRVEDVRVQAADAAVAGGSSIALLIKDGATAELARCDLTAGNGAAGEPGGKPAGGSDVERHARQSWRERLHGWVRHWQPRRHERCEGL